MKTNDLIDQLATELEAVQPLKPPLRRAVLWMAGSVLYFAALAVIVTRFGIAEVGISFSLFVAQLIGLVAGVAAAIAAFATVVPGYSRRILVWPVVAIAGWLAVFIGGAINGDAAPGIAASTHEWACVGMIVIGGLPLIGVLATMLRRGAPMSPGLTGLLGALAVGLFANFGACVSLPHESFLVTLVWHGGALSLLVVLGIAACRVQLKWHTSPDGGR
jgi:hypothetical protein